MQVTHYFDASLTSPAITTIPAMQGDGIRLVVARLLEGEEPWVVPEGVKAGLSYELPGKEPGYYDRLDDGTAACVIDGNQVFVVLEPVLTERPGPVKLSIILRDPDGTQVATFPFYLWVTRVPGYVHGENLPASVHRFEGKIYYGGPGGVLQPMGLGEGTRAVQQEDGSFLLVTENGTGSIVEELDPTVPEWAKQPQKPGYTAEEVGAEAAGTAANAIAWHNDSKAAHGGVWLTVQSLVAQVTALADCDDQTLDQLSEIVAYIKSNKSLIDAVTTSKVSVADIVDDLVTDVGNKPLSARMGYTLKNLLDLHEERYDEKYDALDAAKLDAAKLPGAVDERIRGFEQSKDLELITSFTLTEAVSTLTIDRDAGGQPFSLETAVFELHTGTTGECGEGNSGAVGLRFLDNANVLAYLYTTTGFPYQAKTSVGFRDTGITAYATVRNKLSRAHGKCGDFGTVSNPMGYSINCTYATGRINKIQIFSNLPANATVSVYGVRSENNA